MLCNNWRWLHRPVILPRVKTYLLLNNSPSRNWLEFLHRIKTYLLRNN